MITTPHDDTIRLTCGVYGLPFDLVQTQVLHESSGKADAFRFESAFYEKYIQHNLTAKGFSFGPLAACSYGLMQVLLETALEDGFTGDPQLLFIPRVGLNAGCKHLRKLWDALGGTPETYRQALARYNGTGDAATQYADAIYLAAGRTV